MGHIPQRDRAVPGADRQQPVAAEGDLRDLAADAEEVHELARCRIPDNDIAAEGRARQELAVAAEGRAAPAGTARRTALELVRPAVREVGDESARILEQDGAASVVPS